MTLESLEDLFEIDHEKLKAAENKRLITRIKQLMKGENKSEKKADEAAENMPYEGVGIVGNKAVSIKFDLETKEARVVDVRVDPRDLKGRNHMAALDVTLKLKNLIRKQKENDNGN